MIMNTNDGGQAFPTPYITRDGDHYSTEYEGGMSLRDYFAAKAMQGYMAGTLAAGRLVTGDIARASYLIADDMLAERSKQR